MFNLGFGKGKPLGQKALLVKSLSQDCSSLEMSGHFLLISKANIKER